MEPVVTTEGFKVLQNPEESRSMLSAYYESQGFHVITKEKTGDHAAKQGPEMPVAAGTVERR
jgi:hypothetical protein